MSARHIIHQTSAFVLFLAEVLLYYLVIFVGGGTRFGAGYPRNATDTHTTGF